MSRVFLILTLLVCAAPAMARSVGCGDIAAARSRGLSNDEIQTELQTTLGKIRTCDQAAAIHDRVAEHRLRADMYRTELQRRFDP